MIIDLTAGPAGTTCGVLLYNSIKSPQAAIVAIKLVTETNKINYACDL